MMRPLSAVFIAALLTSCSPSVFSPTVTGQAGGSATYQVVVGQRAHVDLFINDMSEAVGHLVMSFVGSNDWFADHQSIKVDPGPCAVRGRQLDCGLVLANAPISAPTIDISMSGVATKPGRIEYTLALWSVRNGNRQAINAADGHQLTLHWIEGVAAA
jgi:hypothetical protein